MLPIGENVRVDNFVLCVVTRSVSKDALKKMREETGLPAKVFNNIKEGRLPFLSITTVAQDWRMEFAVTHPFFNAFSELYGENGFTGDAYDLARYLLQLFYTDTTVVGDGEYQQDKIKALARYLQRQKADENKEEEQLAAEMQEHAEIIEKMNNDIKGIENAENENQ